MLLRRLIWFFLPVSVSLLSSCGGWVHKEALVDVNQQLAASKQSMSELIKRLDKLEGHLAYCSDEVKHLLSNVQQVCPSSAVCTSDRANIQRQVMISAPQQKGRFLSLFQERKHLAFYFSQKNEHALTEPEKKSLRDLVKPAWFDDETRHTRFLVVSNINEPSPAALDEARNRGISIINAIAEIGKDVEQVALPPAPAPSSAASEPAPAPTPAAPSAKPSHTSQVDPELVRSGRVLLWIFPFAPVTPTTIPQEDRPKAQNQQLNRSVWVYRVDC